VTKLASHRVDQAIEPYAAAFHAQQAAEKAIKADGAVRGCADQLRRCRGGGPRKRLGVVRIFTLDRRDFAMVRPRHAAAFELLPAPC
jgi:hypothetical protein